MYWRLLFFFYFCTCMMWNWCFAQEFCLIFDRNLEQSKWRCVLNLITIQRIYKWSQSEIHCLTWFKISYNRIIAYVFQEMRIWWYKALPTRLKWLPQCCHAILQKSIWTLLSLGNIFQVPDLSHDAAILLMANLNLFIPI